MCVVLLLSTLYNNFKIKWAIVAIMVFFEAGSALCGAAPTITTLIVDPDIAGTINSGLYLG